MEIKNNIIKHYLRNALFINGTAYAGKSTMCKLLAEKYDLVHCEENYNSDVIFNVINEEDQPNLSYFNTKKSWEEYLNRTPEVYHKWVKGNDKELFGFEIAEIIRLSQNKKVIVDTNIPINILNEIADYHQIAIMLSNESMAVNKFFDREDEDKKFLLEQINKCPNPREVKENFIAGQVLHHKSDYDMYLNCGCYTIIRDNLDECFIDKAMPKLAKHFKLIE
ncbi:MAG: hypothetical protein HN948_07180 [Clostridia bacterium]|jgi:hypothetical protein|nr:hypothetical protein [Clostridia bacterium]MBT7122776.1 hypothetical protein [Clostridia bacterium]